MKKVALFLVLLLPSAYFAWQNADMPQFGRWIHDDSVYFVSAKSIAGGQGYRILSFPGQPFQTKYPPLHPLLLAGVWKINPNFPANLALGTFVSWLSVPFLLFMCLRLFLAYGFPEKQAWAMTALFAVNPYVTLFGASMLSELPFTCLLILCLLLCRRAADENSPWYWAVLAGAVGGLAYLTRSTALALLLSGIAYFAWKRFYRQAFWFAATMLPFMAGWAIWTRLHAVHTSDPVTIYYTSYLGYHLQMVTLADMPVILWKNLDQWLLAVGALIVPELGDGILIKIATQTLGVAILAGVVRMVRQGQALEYSLFAVPFSVMLAVWHYPPTERLVTPIYPLLLAGFWSEAQHVHGMISKALRHRDRSQRVSAAIMGGLVLLVLAGGAWRQYEIGYRVLPDTMALWRKQRSIDEEAFRWMAANLPNASQVLTYNDPVLFLYTGHQSSSLTIPSILWYRDDKARVRNAYASLASFARARHLDFAYFTKAGSDRDMGAEDRDEVAKTIKLNPELEVIQQFDESTVYRILPPK
jgi:hypothetical protein